jgi:predicted DNA-binding WGR domain protein
MDQQTKDPDVLNVLVLERVDRTKNMARYYVLSVEPTLFTESSLVRRWGRIGGAGRTRIDLHASPPLAQIALNTWLETQAAPRLPTPRLIAGSWLFVGVFLRPRRIRNAESARYASSHRQKVPAIVAAQH